ncbi:MAG: cadherin domain-containing protein [Chloroflexi bacterium]|nr:cadherin domain-containing protein [Chloroflexota bacterium]
MKHHNWKYVSVLILVAILALSMAGVSPAYAAIALTVTTNADSGAGSLRNIITSASAGNTINFDAGLAGQTITLLSTLTIDKDLTIDGSALTTPITISGGNAVRVLWVNSSSAALTLQNLTIANGGIATGDGAGVLNEGTLTITNSTFSGNSASGYNGGGIFNYFGTLTITNSTFSGNSATSGGGLFNTGTLTVTNSTFSGNSASDPSFGGGGIYSDYGTVTISNSTFSSNTADGRGGGFYNFDGSTTITNSTFSGNSGASGAGGIEINSGDLTLSNTIVANSAAGGNCAGTLTDGGNNLDSADTCGFTINAEINTNPSLDALLADNGGPTQTFALLADSPAIGAGDDAACAAAPVNNLDQRGFTRPSGVHCDIGAYEYQIPAPTATTNAASAVTATGATLNGTVNANNDSSTVTFEYGLDTSYGDTVTADQSPVTGATDTAVSTAITGLTPSTTYHYRVVATNGTGTTNGSDQTFDTLSNSAPTDITLSNNSVPEHQSSDTLVGTFTTTDADAGDTFTYSLGCASPGADDSSFYVDVDQLLTNGTFDYETKNVYSICVRTTDSAAATFDKNFTIYVTLFNEAPTDLGLSSNIIAENNAVNAVIGTLSASDPNASDTFTYSLTCATPGGDESSFNVNSSELRASAAFDYETKSSYQICIRVTDSGGLTFDQAFTIGIRNLDDTPTSLDPTFGVGGKTTFGFKTFLHGKVTAKFNSNSYGYATAIQADGKIVMAGVSNGDFALARFNSDGSLDTSFGANGLIVTDFGGNDAAFAAAIQSDGKIVLAGSSYQSGTQKFALARYNSDGSLDATFGSNGKVMTDIGGADDSGYAIVIQPDGKIIAAGYSYNSTTTSYDFALARYNSDGSLDATFGAGGKALADFAGGYDQGYSVALQSNGKIVAAGYTYNATTYEDIALARFNTDGSLDTSFGAGGKTTTDFAGNDEEGHTVAIQAVGGVDYIVVGGFTYNSGNLFALARYKTSDGTLDTSFGTNGLVTTAFASNANAYAIAVQPDGSIVAAGQANNPATNKPDFALARYTSNGSLDTSFGTSGTLTTDFSDSYDYGKSVAIQSDGKIVTAGYSDNGSGTSFALTRYNADGTLDDSFGSVSNPAQGRAAAIQSDGKVIMAGFATADTAHGVSNFALARLNTDGSLDTTFGAGGTVTTDFAMTTQLSSNNDAAYAVAIQADGKIVAGGMVWAGWTNRADFGLARYNSDGSLDTAFGSGGKVTTNLGNQTDYIQALAIQTDGKILAAGWSGNSSTDNFVVARYNSDGSLDSTFGSGGIATADFGGQDHISKIALQTDGKIVAVGSTLDTVTYHSNFAVARFNTDGSLDTTFNTTGKLTTDFSGGSDNGYSVAIQTDNKILVAGSTMEVSPPFHSDFALARYNSDGTLDTSFGTGGQLTTDIGENDTAYAILLQPGGHIVAAGSTGAYSYNFWNFAAARYDSSGVLDTSFGANGKVATNFGGKEDAGQAAVLQADTKFVVAGYSDGLFAAARFLGENAAPTDITLSNNTVLENQPIGTLVGVLTASDPDVTDTHTYSFACAVPGADDASFQIGGAGSDELQTAAVFDYETKNTYNICIRTDDGNGGTFQKPFAVTVTDANENSAPADLTLSASIVTENLPAATTVGSFTSTDPNAGDTFAYSLVSGTGSDDNAAFTISDNQLKTAYPFNYLAKNSYSIRVRTTDSGSLSFEKVFTITVTNAAPIFTDVPDSYWAVSWIERLYNNGITGGCSTGPLNFCPNSTVTRAQTAVFLLKGIHGSSYTLPAVGLGTGFTDVPNDYWAAAWIKQLAAEGITSGCGNNNYCPDSEVTRAQMAVFLLKSEHGTSYSPPEVGAGTGFTDVPSDYWAAAWIKQLAAEGITGGCGSGNYCPDSSVTRAQMAVFLVKTFNLP